MVNVENVAFNPVDKLIEYDRQEHSLPVCSIINFGTFSQLTQLSLQTFLAVNILA